MQLPFNDVSPSINDLLFLKFIVLGITNLKQSEYDLTIALIDENVHFFVFFNVEEI